MPDTKSNNNEFSIPHSTFRRLVKEMVGVNNFVSADALDILQRASEDHVTEVLDKAATLAAYGDRTTVYASDVSLVQELGCKVR